MHVLLLSYADLTEKYKLEIPSDDFNITISLKNETRNVTLKSHFKTHKNYTCHEDDYLLIPEEFAQDEFSILSNGSLKMVNSTPDSNFCLASNVIQNVRKYYECFNKIYLILGQQN